ncbi:MAG: hypothetical protein Q4B22_05595, partial [Eubacteriales bacterium]|nr:hypothetical protein [Eubacteriales bacterium]
MNNEYDDRFIDTDTNIHVPDYDPNLGAGQTPSPSADGNLNYYQRMQQGYNNGYPQDGYNSDRPQD